MRTTCRKTFFFIILAVFALMAAPLQAETGAKAKEGEIVANVNDGSVSRKDFDRTMVVAAKQFEGNGFQQQAVSPVNLKKEVLTRLVDFELMLQDSKKRGIVIEDSHLDENVATFKKRLGEEAEFQTFLKENDFTEAEMREQFQRELAMHGLQTSLYTELQEKVSITDEDIKEFYEANQVKFKRPEQVKASHILITVDETADEAAKAEAREKIVSLQKEITAGGDFAEIAKANSQCPSAANGGDLGFFGKGQMVKPFEEAAFSLNVNEVSDVVETQFGYHLIRLEEKREASMTPLDELKDKIEKYLSQQKLEQAQQDYLQGLRDNAKITYLVDMDEEKDDSVKN